MRASIWFAAALAAAGAAMAPGAARADNLIHDGGFEIPPATAGGATLYNPGQTIGPWLVVGGHNVRIASDTAVNAGVRLSAKRGQAFLDLTGNCDCGDATAGVAQAVPTTPGKRYVLTFWVGNCDIPGAGSTSTVNVYADKTLLLSATNASGKGSKKQVWQKFTASFAATAARTTISFLNGDPKGDQENGLDLVTLTPE